MELIATPRLAPGCRLHPTDAVLLIPEGALNLHGPAREILAHLDGKQSVEAIVNELQTQYADVDINALRQDVLSLLDRMVQRGVVRV